jgi:hypothetical protein
LKLGEAFIKIIIKFEDEIRVKPVEIKRAIIKINIKDSISFELREIYYNYNINFDIKTNLRIINLEKLNKLEIDEPIFNNNNFMIFNTNKELAKEDEIHIKYSFQKLENEKDKFINKNKIRYNFDFINQELLKDNININSNTHIIEKLNKILNKFTHIIFFPWKVSEYTNSNSNKIIHGLFPYNIKLEPPYPTKDIIRELIFNSTKVNTDKYNINNKSLIIINLSINKNTLFSFKDIIYKYEIFVNEENPEVTWIGGKKYIIMNNQNEDENNVFNCMFCFTTKLKGLIEVNRISVLLYENNSDLEEKEKTILIEHISKPLSIFLD